jgi:uncharacterized membrane protein
MNLRPNEDNVFKVTLALIKQANVRINAESLRMALWAAPDFPSLASISHVLDEFNVPNLATRLTTDQLAEIPIPAIVHLHTNEDTFALLTDVTPESVTWYHNISGNTKESLAAFANRWEGLTLLIEPNAKSGEADFEINKRTFFIESLRLPLVMVGLLLCLVFLLYPIVQIYAIDNHWQLYALIITKLMGTALSAMLIWYSTDADNPFLNKICQIHKKTNCHSILSSKAANIGGFISWSEIGLIYFLGGCLSLLFFQQDSLPLLRVISLLALPYTFWSVYHQAFVAKIWCPLCLCVQALLWLECMVSLPISITFLPLNTFLELGFWFLAVAVLVVFVKKPLKDSAQIEGIKIELQKLKFSPDFVEILLSKEVFLPSFGYKMQVITVGNEDAEMTLQIVVSPTCGACRRKFLDIVEIVANHDEVKCQIILSSPSDQTEIASQVVKTILGLANNFQKIEALHKWYMLESQNFDTWRSSLKLDLNIIEGEQQQVLHRQWLNELKIIHVPLTYFNNVEIPTLYTTKEAIRLIKYYTNIGFRSQQ